MLCCPEAVIGGLAHESDDQSPADVALEVENGQLAETLAPLMATAVTLIVGFTERDGRAPASARPPSSPTVASPTSTARPTPATGQ